MGNKIDLSDYRDYISQINNSRYNEDDYYNEYDEEEIFEDEDDYRDM